MSSLFFKLNPLSKLKIYTAVREIVLSKMNRDEMTAQKAEEIITYAKTNIVNVKSAEMGIKFCEDVMKKYPELQMLMQKFEKRSLEQYDRVITMIIDGIMEKNAVDEADGLLKVMEKSTTQTEKENLMKSLKAKYPQAFEDAVAEVSHHSQQ